MGNTVFTRMAELPLICCDDDVIACECDSCREWRGARIRAAAARILSRRCLPTMYDSTRPPPSNDNARRKASVHPSRPTVRPPSLPARAGGGCG